MSGIENGRNIGKGNENNKIPEYNKEAIAEMLRLTGPLRLIPNTVSQAVRNDASVTIPTPEDTLSPFYAEVLGVPGFLSDALDGEQKTAYEQGRRAAFYVIRETYAHDKLHTPPAIPGRARELVGSILRDPQHILYAYWLLIDQVNHMHLEDVFKAKEPPAEDKAIEVTTALNTMRIPLPDNASGKIAEAFSPDQVHAIDPIRTEQINPYRAGYTEVFVLVNRGEMERERILLTAPENMRKKISILQGTPTITLEQVFVQEAKQQVAASPKTAIAAFEQTLMNSAATNASDWFFVVGMHTLQEAFAGSDKFNFKKGALIMQKILTNQYKFAQTPLPEITESTVLRVFNTLAQYVQILVPELDKQARTKILIEVKDALRHEARAAFQQHKRLLPDLTVEEIDTLREQTLQLVGRKKEQLKKQGWPVLDVFALIYKDIKDEQSAIKDLIPAKKSKASKHQIAGIVTAYLLYRATSPSTGTQTYR